VRILWGHKNIYLKSPVSFARQSLGNKAVNNRGKSPSYVVDNNIFLFIRQFKGLFPLNLKKKREEKEDE
jgi:hypothetical protein